MTLKTMKQLWRSPVLRYGAIISGLVAVAAVLLPGMRMGALNAANFLPHATCYLRDPRLIALHATSDTLIGAAYLSISATLGYLVYRARQDIPFHWMFMAFGLFIVTCGFTHILAVITVWHPVYWLSGDVKAVTAVASVGTAVALPFLLPRIFGLIQTAKLSEKRRIALERANAELGELYERVKELDEIKSQFFANVSHELRTPLTLITGPAERLARDHRLQAEQLEQVELIRRSSSLLLGQVNNLLEASRLEAGQVEIEFRSLDLAALVRLTASHFRTVGEDRRLAFQVETPESLWVQADPEKLQRVLLNLVGNAVKFVPAGGRVLCRLESRGERARLVVQDNGPGVPPHMRERIFERFRQVEGGSTRRFGGTGLGLAIARDLVELHKGTIHVEETPGGGATFVVDIPVEAPPGAKVAEEEPARTLAGDILQQLGLASTGGLADEHDEHEAEARGDRPTVLVVEDDPQMNRFVCGILRDDYHVVSAYDGADGLKKAVTHQPDLILSDIMMPETSGDRLVPQLRAVPELKETPIILLSAKADEGLQIRLLREGANDFLLKPFSIEEVRAKAANFVALNQARRALQGELDSREGDVAKLAAETIARKKQLEVAIADQKKAEEGLRRLNAELELRVSQRTEALAAANRELELFTSTATHDLRAPLRTISGMTAILLEDHGAALDAEARDYLQKICASVRRMDLLIRDLFAYSRVGQQEVTLEPLPLMDILEAAHDSLREEIHARQAEVVIEPTALRVLGQETLMIQVISNLLSNGLKYVEPGISPRVQIRTEDRGEWVRLSVTDNGLGIDREHQQRIFELFTRLRPVKDYPGSGLGLAILAKAVSRMGGRFGVESQPDQGSTFWVELRNPDFGA